MHFIFHHSTKINKNKQKQNAKMYSDRFSSFLKEQNPSLPPACQTLARYYRVLPSNKHGHALILENQHTHVTFFDTNTFTRARTLMQSFFCNTVFSSTKNYTTDTERVWQEFFYLSFFKCFTWFQRTTLWCKWKKWHICCGLGANNSRQAVK